MKRILVILLLLLLSGGVFAQEKLSDEKRKEIDAQKVALFTQVMDLTPQEAATFWPLYNEMRKKMRDIEEREKTKNRSMKAAKSLKESDYKMAVEQALSSEQKLMDLKRYYYTTMMKIMPASKLWKLEEAERKFHRQLFDRLRREQAHGNK